MKFSADRYNPPKLTIGRHTVPIPVIQGGMGVGISMAGLASAVARAGGIGIIAAVLIGITEDDFIKNPQEATYRALAKQIKLAKEKAPGGVIGVNIMVALTDYEKMVHVASEAGADLIISGAGLPLRLPEYVAEGSSPELVPIVSSGRAAQILCKRWGEHFGKPPSAFVVEGPKAGGHLGFKFDDIESRETKLEKLIPEVVEAVKPFEDKYAVSIPVIAAGGIFTGDDMYNIMKIGASGVQMGTRFVATHECDASDKFKQAYIKATPEDVIITRSPVGMPGRALKGRITERAKRGEIHPPKKCIYQCLKTCDPKSTPYCISMALVNAQRGFLDAGLVFCGANVHRIDKIISVQELMDTLVAEYQEAAKADQEAALC